MDSPEDSLSELLRSLPQDPSIRITIMICLLVRMYEIFGIILCERVESRGNVII